MTARFKDHFSTQSNQYARFRPTYPAELYAYLADVVPGNTRAWDCATGNGQVAVALAQSFQEVIASDASASQVAAAMPHPKIEYRVATAEASGIQESSIDLLTVGQAFHWFEEAAFFQEAIRVLNARGVLAIWCYETCLVSKACDAIIDHLYSDVVGEFWPPERVLIEQGYDDVNLPGPSLQAPTIAMSANWTATDMLGYLSTWSACHRFQAEHSRDPVLDVEAAIRHAWGDGSRAVIWPLKLKLSRPNSLLE